jgi:hypothetical protein
VKVTAALRRIVREMQDGAWLEYKGPDYRLHFRLTEGVASSRRVRWATVGQMKEMGLLDSEYRLSAKAWNWK